MKKQFLVLMIVFISATSYAQKGSWYVGGVGGYGSHTVDPAGNAKSNINTWAFGPEVGTFLEKDIQLGFILGLNGSTEKSGGNKIAESTSFSPTIYTRKFKKVTDNFSLFAGLYFNYQSGNVKDFVPVEVKTTGSGFGISLGVGAAYSLSSRWTAVGQYGLLGYSSIKFKREGTETSKESNFNFGVNTVGSGSFVQGNGSGSVFNIGLYYTFHTN
jgi:hypothetical protein